MDVDLPRFLAGRAPAGDDAPTARRITRLDWTVRPGGPSVDRWSHLHVVEGRPARPGRLTAATGAVAKIAWSPDGRRIAFVTDSRRRPTPAQHVHLVDPGGRGRRGRRQPTPREVLALGRAVITWRTHRTAAGWPGSAMSSRMRRTTPARSSSSAWPMARPVIWPGAKPRLADGTWNDRPPGLGRQLAGHAVLTDDRTIVAMVSDRGQATPCAVRGGSRAGARRRLWPLTHIDLSAESPRGDHRPVGREARRVTLWPSTGAAAGAVTLPVRTGGAAQLPGPGVTRVPGRAPAYRRCSPSRPRRRRTDRDLDAPQRTRARRAPHDRRHPRRPARRVGSRTLLEVVPLRSRLPGPPANIRGSTSTAGTGSGRSSAMGRRGRGGRPRGGGPRGFARPRASRPLGVLGLSYGGFMALALAQGGSGPASESGVTNQVSAWGDGDTGVESTGASSARRSTRGHGQPVAPEPPRPRADIRPPAAAQGEADQRCPPADNMQRSSRCGCSADGRVRAVPGGPHV